MASKHIVTVSQQNFAAEVLQSAEPVLVDFWAEWCGPCKAIAPILDELAEEYGGRIKIAKINVDHEQGLAAEYGVTAIPTLIIFRGGQVVEQMRGLRSKRDLKHSLDAVAA